MIPNLGYYLYGAISKEFAYEDDLKQIQNKFSIANANTGFKIVGWDYNGTQNPDRLRILVKTPDSYYEYNKTDFEKTDQKP